MLVKCFCFFVPQNAPKGIFGRAPKDFLSGLGSPQWGGAGKG